MASRFRVWGVKNGSVTGFYVSSQEEAEAAEQRLIELGYEETGWCEV